MPDQEDPFKKYGGKQIDEPQDPFKKYGGQAIAEPIKKKGILSGVGGVALQNGSQTTNGLLNGGGGGRKVDEVAKGVVEVSEIPKEEVDKSKLLDYLQSTKTPVTHRNMNGLEAKEMLSVWDKIPHKTGTEKLESITGTGTIDNTVGNKLKKESLETKAKEYDNLAIPLRDNMPDASNVSAYQNPNFTNTEFSKNEIDKATDFFYKDRIYNEAVKWYASKNPQFAKELEATGIEPDKGVMYKIPDVKLGNIVSHYLSQPDLNAFIEKERPDLYPAFESVSRRLITDNKDYGLNVMANEISQEIQNSGYNNIEPIFNFKKGVKEAGDIIGTGLYQNDPAKNKFYQENKEEILNMLDAPSFFEGFASTIKGAGKGIKNTFTQPFESVSETVKNNWENEINNVTANPKGITKFIRDVGSGTGFVASIAAPGGILKAAGLSPKTASAVSITTTFFGDQLEQGVLKYPDNPVKAWTSATLNTTLYAALAYDLFPAEKAAKAMQVVKPEVEQVVKNLSSGAITRETARKEMQTITKKAVDAIGGALKTNTKASLEMAAITAVNKKLDKVFMDEDTYNEFHTSDEEAETFKHLFMSNSLVSAMSGYGAMKQRNKLFEESIYNAASNPKKFQREIEKLKISNPEINDKELYENLKFVKDVKDLVDSKDMSEKNKKAYLAEALKAKVARDGMKASPEETVLRKYDEQAKRSDEIKEKLLNGEDADKIVTEAEVEANKEKLKAEADRNKLIEKGQKAIDKLLEEKDENDKNVFTGVYRDVAKKDPEGFLEDISEQAFGTSHDGTPLKGGGREKELVKSYGADIVNTAKELFPKKEIKEEPIPDLGFNEETGEATSEAKTEQPSTGLNRGDVEGKGEVATVKTKEEGKTDVSKSESKVEADKDATKDEGRSVVGDKTFITHKNEVVSGKKLTDAINKVADDMVENAYAVRKEDLYASHVTETEKEETLAKRIKYAEEVRQGEHLNNLSIAQRINYELTGESVPILPLQSKATVKEGETKDQSLSPNIEPKPQSTTEGGVVAEPKIEAEKSEKTTQDIENQPPEPPKPPKDADAGKDGDGGGRVELSHKGLQDVANEFSLPDVRKRDRKSDIELKKEADELVKEWAEKGQYAKNVEELIKDAEAGEILTDKERVVLERHLANLSAELRGIADKTSPEFDAKLKEIIRLKDAGEKTRSEAGAALRIPGGGSLPHPVVDFAEAVVTMKEAVGEKDLTPQQKAEVEKMVSAYEQRAKSAEQRVADMEAKFAEMQAQKSAEKTKKSKGEYKSERDNIRKSIKEKWAAASKDGTLTAVAVPYAKQLMAIAPDVAKLVKSYVSEGITEFSEVVKKVHDLIKDLNADISESDVVDVIAGKYDAVKETRLDLVKKLKQIKDQKSAEAIKIRARIKSGDFAKKELPTSWVNNPEFKKKYPKEYKEAIDAIDAREQAKLDFDIAVYKAERAKRSTGRKGIDFVRALIATTKAVKSGIDDSAVMMQNIVAMISHPRSAVKALKEHALDALSEKRFRRYLTELHESPIWPLIEKSGLDITDPKSLKEQNKEEIFDNNLLNKDIKIRGKKYNVGKYLTRPFERAFTSLGNAMRVNMFTRIAERMMEEGKTFETHPEEFKSLARVLNTETGRGKLHTQIERASQLVTAGIWSPRLMSSRINMLGLSELAPLYGGKGYYAGLTPQMRKMALADMAKFLGAGVALMAFAGSQGAGVDDDPESPTFGTIKIGNKKYNAWGGFTPYAKTIYQGVSGHRNVGGERKEIAKSKLLGSFFRSRLTPAAGVTTDLLTGEDFSGKPATAGGSLMNLIAPLSVMAMIDAVRKDGMTGVLNQGLPSFVGVGVSDERDFERGNKRLTKEEKEDPTFKYFIDKGINFPELDPKKIETKSVNGKPTEHLSDLPKETQEKYIETKKRYLKEELQALKDGKKIIAVNQDGTASIVSSSQGLIDKDNMKVKKIIKFEDLTEEQLQYILSGSIYGSISEKVKKEILK